MFVLRIVLFRLRGYAVTRLRGYTVKGLYGKILFHQGANDENEARKLQDIPGEEPADGEPFEVLSANRVPMLNRAVPPFAGELALGVVAELI